MPHGTTLMDSVWYMVMLPEKILYAENRPDAPGLTLVLGCPH